METQPQNQSSQSPVLADKKLHLGVILLVVLLVASTLFFGYRAYVLDGELDRLKASGADVAPLLNQPVLNFSRLFVEKVLEAEAEIDFETRLELENAVRDLNDVEILAKWNDFTKSDVEAEAQKNVRALLKVLLERMEK